MYSKILVAVDGGELSERAIQQAEVIGQATKAEVILFQVVQNPIRHGPDRGGAEGRNKSIEGKR